MKKAIHKIAKAGSQGIPPDLLAVLALLHLASMAMMVTFSQYLQKNFFASISFDAFDGHCETTLGEGVGIHCFGDYALISKVLDTDNPWQNEVFDVNYGAPLLVFFLIPKAIEGFFGSFDAGLFFYLATMVLALSVPLLIIARSLLRAKGGVFLFAIGAMLSGPLSLTSIIALDRGNSVGFVVPVLAWFAWAHINGKHTQVSIAAGIAALIRPQFGLLLFALFAARKFRLFFLSLGLITTSYFLSYLVFFESFPSNVLQSIRNILAFGTRSGSDVWPPNVSLSRGVQFIIPENVALSQVLAIAAVIGFLALIVVIPGTFRPADLAFALLVLASLSSPVSWSYSLVFAQVAVFGVLWDYAKKDQSSEFSPSHSPSLAWTPGLVLSLMSFASLNPPASSLVLAPAGWLLSLALVTLLVLTGPLKLEWLRVILLSMRTTDKPPKPNTILFPEPSAPSQSETEAGFSIQDGRRD